MGGIFTSFLSAGQEAILLIGRAVLPVLFPFFVITSLIINISNTNNKYFVAGLSYISGYPNGTRLSKLLYEKGSISQEEAKHLCILSSTPSPIFVVATVGTIFLQNTKLGVVIFLCSVISAILNGFLWRPKFKKKNVVVKKIKSYQSTSVFKAFNDAIYSSTTAVINVCGVVLFFFIFTRLLNMPPLLSGLFEMTTGVSQTINPLLIQFFVCFGGLSIAVQNLLFAESLEIKFWYYVSYKFTHALIATALLSVYLLF